MYAASRILQAALLTCCLSVPVFADETAAPTREQLQQAAATALAARDAAAVQVETARTSMQQAETELLEARRAVKKAEQEQAAAEGRLAAEQEAATKAAEAKTAADAAKAAADTALATAREAVKPELGEAEKAAAEKAVADAQTKVDETTKAATDAAAAAEAAQTALTATQKTITDSKAAVETGNAQIATLQTKLDESRAVLTTAETQLATATTEWIAHQRALETDLRSTGEWVSFPEEIAPILQQRCVACHNTKTAKGRLNLVTFSALMKGGESGPAVEAGDDEFSPLCAMVEDGSMPADADPLTPEQVALIKKWVKLGVQLDAGTNVDLPLIRIMPRPEQPTAPETYRLPIPVTAAAFSPDGAMLATSGYHEVLLWNAADGTLLRRIGNVAERVYDLEFHADGQQLVIAAGTPGQMGEVRIVHAGDGTLLREVVVTEDSMFAASFSPDGTKLAAAGADRAIRIFNMQTGAEEVLIEDHADWVMAIAWSPDGTRIASASRDKTAKLFDAATGDAQVTFNGHGDMVFGVGFLPDGTQVASAGADDRIRTWTVEKAEQKLEIKGYGGDVLDLQVLPDSTSLSCSEDKTARLHSLSDGKEVRQFAGHSDWVYSASAHAGIKRVATGSYDGSVRLWNLEDGSLVLTFRAAPGLEQVSIEASK